MKIGIQSFKDSWQESSWKNFRSKPLWYKAISAIVFLFIVFIVIGILSPKGQKSAQEGKEAGSKASSKTESTSTATPQPSLTPSSETAPTLQKNLTPYEIISQIGKDVAGGSSNVSVFKNSDGSIDVINNIQFTPEVTWGMDAAIRKWVTEFLSKSYTTDLDIRYVLVTVSPLGTGRPATRVGLGADLAKKYTKEEWQEFTPYDLCKWLTGIQDGDDIDPSDPSYDPSTWAFAKNYDCG